MSGIGGALGRSLAARVRGNDGISVTTTYFSVCTFTRLGGRLGGISRLHFVFASPAFVGRGTGHRGERFCVPERRHRGGLFNSRFRIGLHGRVARGTVTGRYTR